MTSDNKKKKRSEIVIISSIVLNEYLCNCSQTGLQPHHRCRVWFQSGQCCWEDGQTADMGHSRPGALPVTCHRFNFETCFCRWTFENWMLLSGFSQFCDTQLLSRSSRRTSCLWHCQVKYVLLLRVTGPKKAQQITFVVSVFSFVFHQWSRSVFHTNIYLNYEGWFVTDYVHSDFNTNLARRWIQLLKIASNTYSGYLGSHVPISQVNIIV